MTRQLNETSKAGIDMIGTKLRCLTLILFLAFLLAACGGDESSDNFQTNRHSPFELAKITEGYGAVDEAWESIDAMGFNTRLGWTVDAVPEEYEIASYCLADILTAPNEPLAKLIRTDLSNILSRIVDTQPSHHESENGIDTFFQGGAEEQARNFYAFLDKTNTDGIDVPDDYFSGMIDKLIDYTILSIPTNASGQPNKAWLNSQVQAFVENLLDEDFMDNFVKITKLISKLTIQTDYPMWLDEAGLPVNKDDIQPSVHTNIDLGNAVQGTHDLVVWLNKIIQNPDTNPLIHDTAAGFANIFDPDLLATRLRDYIVNVEDYFTIGGEVYATNSIYSENSEATYSDAEIGQTLREFFPFVQKLFLRSDRFNAIISSAEGQTPVYPFELMLSNLRNIGFDPNNIDIERSIYDLLRYDVWGRDRVNDPEAWPTSYLESLLFLTHATSHHGWRDGGDTTEVTGSTDSRSAHGHGTYVEELTLNDSLFSIKMLKTYEYLGIYEISLKPTDGNHIYRTKTPFTLSEVDELHTGTVMNDDKDYRFFYDANYGALQFLAGPGPGDLGAPDGGNPDGRTIGMNQYLAYSPNGLHETQLAAWTMGWAIRACFNGEGPFYYADPYAETVFVDGVTYHKYFRPDGKIYAFVSLDGSSYLYPTDDGDVEDTETAVLPFNHKRQRDNRYKSQWRSDYYISHFTSETLIDGTEQQKFFTLDNSSGDTVIRELSGNLDSPAGSLVYNELIHEADPARACASPEEAFFRNYQWVMNEKKMVFLVPLYLNLGDLKAVAFEIYECNGFSGLANMRKYRERGVWAKKGDAGLSTIPGDYRIEVVAAADGDGASVINSDSIYNENMDCGNATPAVVAHNLPAAYRLGFPRSPAMDRGNNITDHILGSKEFVVGDNDFWNNRNAFMPILFSLLAAIREYTPAYHPGRTPDGGSGLRMFLTHSPLLIKPLFYYNRDAAAAGTPNSWIPRVYGSETYGNYRGKPFLQSTADFYDGTPETWFGSWRERRHFQPAVLKSQFNILIDSDITSVETDENGDMVNRCDGILPLITTKTKLLTHFFKLTLNPAVDPFPLEQQLSAIKYTKGELTTINESSESGKNVVFPNWMFSAGVEETRDAYGAYTQYTNVRDEEIILDDILNFVIGHDTVDENNEGYGIANYPDNKSTDADWKDFNDTIATVCDLFHNDSSYSITPNLLYLMDRIFGRDPLYSINEISGLLYNIGKLFGYFDTDLGRWVYQGEDSHSAIYNMLTLRIPDMHTVVTQNEVEDPTAAGGPPDFYGYGDRYYAQLILLKNMSGPDGLIQFLLNTATVSQNWEEIFSDLNRFLDGYDVSHPKSLLWITLADLLRDMGKAVGETNNSNLLDDILEDYGFQSN
jgi:hypothetical protein